MEQMKHYITVSDQEHLEKVRQIRQNSPAWQARGEKIAQKARERWQDPEFREKRISQLSHEMQSGKGRGNKGRPILVDGKFHFDSINAARAHAHENGLRLRLLTDDTGEFYYPASTGALPITILGYRFKTTRGAIDALDLSYHLLSKYRAGTASPKLVAFIEDSMRDYLDKIDAKKNSPD